MAKYLSEDLRIRVIEAVAAGASRRRSAARFGVSVSSAIRWVDVWRRTGRTAPYPRGGGGIEACCGINDCRTAKSLGYPKIIRNADGSYEVEVGKHWIRYDFPAVYPSEDSKAWVCYMESSDEPVPLCLFLPRGMI